MIDLEKIKLEGKSDYERIHRLKSIINNAIRELDYSSHLSQLVSDKNEIFHHKDKFNNIIKELVDLSSMMNDDMKQCENEDSPT